MKIFVVTLVLLSQGLFASENIDFASQINNSLKEQSSAEKSYQDLLANIPTRIKPIQFDNNSIVNIPKYFSMPVVKLTN